MTYQTTPWTPAGFAALGQFFRRNHAHGPDDYSDVHWQCRASASWPPTSAHWQHTAVQGERRNVGWGAPSIPEDVAGHGFPRRPSAVLQSCQPAHSYKENMELSSGSGWDKGQCVLVWIQVRDVTYSRLSDALSQGGGICQSLSLCLLSKSDEVKKTKSCKSTAQMPCYC